MNVEMIVRGTDGSRKGTVPDWLAEISVAVLSVNPESLAEFSAALLRYHPQPRLEATTDLLSSSLDPVAEAGGTLFIDLVSQSIYCGHENYQPVDENGPYECDGECPDEMVQIFFINLAEAWLVLKRDTAVWQQTIRRRADETTKTRENRVAPRKVMYGSELSEFISQRVGVATEQKVWSKTDRDKHVRAIHVDWLMTAQPQLDGQTIRQVLHADKEHVDRELQWRAIQWSRTRKPPVALDENCAAYDFGGFGTAEIVLYFELVRGLLLQAWELVASESCSTAELIPRLNAAQNEWLDAPDEYSTSRTRRQLIDEERRRLPLLDDGHMHEDDCPICQAMQNSDMGPSFTWFDGCHLELEDEFAFSLVSCYDEWEMWRRATSI